VTNITGPGLDLLALLLQMQPILTSHNQWLLKTRFYSTVTYGERRIIPRFESYVTTDGQSASLSWKKAPIWGLRPDFYRCLTVAGLLMGGALSDETTGLSFTIAAGPRQRSHSRGPSLVELGTIFHCLRFESSLFVASYDLQGYGGGIRTRLHTGFFSVTAHSLSWTELISRRTAVRLLFCFSVFIRCHGNVLT
jgi:hypothetical protein